MSKLTIWHNPRCSKSRQTLALIEAAGADVEIIRYLDDAPSLAEIETMLAQLGQTEVMAPAPSLDGRPKRLKTYFKP